MEGTVPVMKIQFILISHIWSNDGNVILTSLAFTSYAVVHNIVWLFRSELQNIFER